MYPALPAQLVEATVHGDFMALSKCYYRGGASA